MEIDQDDAPVGRVLTRREVLALFGAAGTAATLAACAPGAASSSAASAGSSGVGADDGDGIYATGGDQLLLDVSGDPAAGYSATFPIGLQVA